MGTIVQEYGPIYGEVVNGTVQGRPNGSVYVPISNSISLALAENRRFVKYRYFGGIWYLSICFEDGSLVGITQGYVANAVSQDLASNIQAQMYSDSELTKLEGVYNHPAGLFNVSFTSTATEGVNEDLVDGDTIYLRAQLLNNGVPVATSNVIELKLVVSE